MLEHSVSSFTSRWGLQANPCEKPLDFSLSCGSVVVVNTCGLSVLSAHLISCLSRVNGSYLFISYYRQTPKGDYPGRQDIYNLMSLRVFPNKPNPLNPLLFLLIWKAHLSWVFIYLVRHLSSHLSSLQIRELMKDSRM